MNFPEISELELAGVFDRGVPNKERIAIRARVAVDMAQFGVILGLKMANGEAWPLHDNFFWLGGGAINALDWILLYTRAGAPSSYVPDGQTCKVYSVFWGKPTVVFQNPNLIPILFRIGGVELGMIPGETANGLLRGDAKP